MKTIQEAYAKGFTKGMAWADEHPKPTKLECLMRTALAFVKHDAETTKVLTAETIAEVDMCLSLFASRFALPEAPRPEK